MTGQHNVDIAQQLSSKFEKGHHIMRAARLLLKAAGLMGAIALGQSTDEIF